MEDQTRNAMKPNTSLAPTSFWKQLIRQFCARRQARGALYVLGFLLFVALTADFIANDKPLYCKLEGQTHFPAFKQYAVNWGWSNWDARFLRESWQDHNYDAVIWPIIPYAANSLDLKNARFRGPFETQDVPSRRFRHWLGTDRLGRDVAAGLVSGTRTALKVGLISMSIAAFLGILLGALAGYYGNDGLRISRIRILCNILAFYLALFYGFISRGLAFREAAESGTLLSELSISLVIVIGVFVLMNLLPIPLKRIPVLGKKVRVAVDFWVMRSIEVVNAIPSLLLILAVLAIIRKPSIVYVMLVIGLVQWTGIARFFRAEMLKLRNREYVEAAKLLGYSDARIILRHLLPNAIGPVLIAVAFGIASAILVEASLAFLGLGGSPDQVSWGSMLSQARQSVAAWWLALFPGVAIFISVTLFNLLGDGLSQAMGRR